MMGSCVLYLLRVPDQTNSAGMTPNSVNFCMLISEMEDGKYRFLLNIIILTFIDIYSSLQYIQHKQLMTIIKHLICVMLQKKKKNPYVP